MANKGEPVGAEEIRFQAALNAYMAADDGAAAAALESILRARADHAPALHLLGLVRFRCGRPTEALDLIEAAIRGDRSRPAFHADRAAVLNALGLAGDAESAARHAVALDPDNAGAHNNLAVALARQGRNEEAAAAARRAVALAPEDPGGHITLGNVHMRRGHAADAVRAYGAALERAPDHVLAHTNLAAALREAGDLTGAESHARHALQRSPVAETHNVLGTILIAKGDGEGAAAAFRDALKLRPGFPEALVNLAAALYRLDRLDAAEDAYRRALALADGHAEAHNGLGIVLLAAGRMGEAADSFRRAVAHDPGHAEAWFNLAASGTRDLTQDEVAAIEARLGDEAVGSGDRIRFHFALGEVLDRRGEASKAFSHFQSGNRLRRDVLTQAGHVFDADAHDRRLGRIASLFTPDWFAPRCGYESDSRRPVFIVGMPRSGTTLVEQIAASHPAVHGAGELGLVARLVGRLQSETGVPFPDCVTGLERERAAAVAAHVSDALSALDRSAERVIDKTPFNFLYLGLIRLLFPQAAIVHCRREPLDLCLSCYFQDFVDPYPWATHLEALGRYHAAYARLMDHWRRVLPGAMLEVAYEDLVADPETESRRLIDHLGLSWNEACLRFHETRRVVRSASSWQVRRPLYASSVGRARAYETVLGPLAAALGG